MDYQRPAIAIIDRPAHYPDLASGGRRGWEMRIVDGPPPFRNYPSRIATDDPVRAGNNFAVELGVHAHRTGTRPWLLFPQALETFQKLPSTHLYLCFSDQPTPAIAKRPAASDPDSPLRWTTRVDANQVGHATLMLDVVGTRWRLTRIDPVYRESGRVRIVASASAERLIEVQSETAEAIGLNQGDFSMAGDLMRRHFWQYINPKLQDPFADGLSDPALKEHELTWVKGSPEGLAALFKTITWADHQPGDQNYPFEVTVETAMDEGAPPRILIYDRISDALALRFERALQENTPVGWHVRREGDDGLPRRSDWRRVPINIKFAIPAPTGHEAMEAEFDLAEWLNPSRLQTPNAS